MSKVFGIRLGDHAEAMVEEIMVKERLTKAQVIRFAIRYMYNHYSRIQRESQLMETSGDIKTIDLVRRGC